MNRVTKRTWLMGLFLAILLGGMGLFAIEYVANAGTWIVSPALPMCSIGATWAAAPWSTAAETCCWI